MVKSDLQRICQYDKQQVWQMTCKSIITPDCRCVKNKWFFKIKCNGVHKVHLVACGYSQVHSVNFSKNFSQVVNDITLHILQLMVLHFSYSAKIVFVEADLSPRYVKHAKRQLHHLNKCIYSLVQVARQ